MRRVLIVYYSRSGNTRRVAQQLAFDLGADLEEIVDPTNRPRPVRLAAERLPGVLPTACTDCAGRT